jgi:Na+/proline symporter
MKPTRVRILLVVVAVTAVLGLLLQRMLRASGWDMPPVPWTAAIGLALVACLVYSAGLPVRRFIQGGRDAKRVDPLRAARIAVLGKSTAYAGAVVLGWYLAQVLLLAPDLDIDSRRAQALRAAITALAALAVCVCGLLAERMCRVPPPPEDRPGEGTSETDVTDEVRRHE